jgi:hypothetical protein
VRPESRLDLSSELVQCSVYVPADKVETVLYSPTPPDVADYPRIERGTLLEFEIPNAHRICKDWFMHLMIITAKAWSLTRWSEGGKDAGQYKVYPFLKGKLLLATGWITGPSPKILDV